MNIQIATGFSTENFESLRSLLRGFIEEKKRIFISINNGRLKVDKAPSIVTALYERFVKVETKLKNYTDCYTIMLVDFLTGKVKIDVE